MSSPASPLSRLGAPSPAPPRTPIPRRPGRRNPAPPAPESSVGALWVAGLGAFLVIVGAATFVAVRWDEIPSTTKLGALVAVTLGCLAAHRLLRETLPVTSAVLLHLGVLLTPIDVAAVGMGLHWQWPRMLLAVGIATAVVPSVAERADRSFVLRLAGGLGVVLVAGGLAAETHVPAALLLAAVALVAALAPRLDREPEAVAWATLAGMALPLAAVRTLDLAAADALADLRLATTVPPVAAVVMGLLAGVALAVVGRRRGDVVLALVGVGCVATGAASAWLRLETDTGGMHDPNLTLVALATLALLTEVAAWTWRNDAFWRQVTGAVAVVAEVTTVVVTYLLLVALVDTVGDVDPSPSGALAGVLVALTWATVMVRRPLAWADPTAPGWRFRGTTAPVDAIAPGGMALAAAAAVALGTASPAGGGLALAAAAVAVLLADPERTVGRTGTRASGVAAALGLAVAPLVIAEPSAVEDPHGWAVLALAAAVAFGGALVVAVAAVRMSRSPRLRADEVAMALPLFTLLALGPVAVGAGMLADEASVAAGVLVAVTVLWGLAAVLDGAGSRLGRLPVSMLPRVAMAVPVAGAMTLDPMAIVLLAALAAALVLLDAVRLDEPVLLVGTGAALLCVTGAAAVAAGVSEQGAGLALTATGLGWLVVGRSLPRRYADVAAVNAVVAAVAGIGLSMSGDRLVAVNLLLVGAVTAAIGALLARRDVLLLGAAMATCGLWIQLEAAGIEMSEPYVAPVAAAALAAGLVARGNDPRLSSWVAYAPAVGLMGGAGLSERLAGGSAWHAVLAGAVGVVAVVVGAAYRLVGPMLAGTALVLAVAIHETLGVTAQVPTWLWLCAGGVALLGAGVGMERRGLGPVDAGRRVADVIRSQYS